MNILNKFLSLSGRKRLLWLTITIFAPYTGAIQIASSALRADALDDRRYEAMSRNFTNRLESDKICAKLALSGQQLGDACLNRKERNRASHLSGI